MTRWPMYIQYSRDSIEVSELPASGMVIDPAEKKKLFGFKVCPEFSLNQGRDVIEFSRDERSSVHYRNLHVVVGYTPVPVIYRLRWRDGL